MGDKIGSARLSDDRLEIDVDLQSAYLGDYSRLRLYVLPIDMLRTGNGSKNGNMSRLAGSQDIPWMNTDARDPMRG